MVLECGSLSHLETSGPVQGLFCVCNAKTMCCRRFCARLISPPSFRSTVVKPVTSPLFPVLIINQTSYGAVKSWTCMYVLVSKEGSSQLLQRQGFCVEGFYWTTTVHHYTDTTIKWRTIHILLLKSLCLSVRPCVFNIENDSFIVCLFSEICNKWLDRFAERI
jgi:hypothetical protein